MNRPPRNKRTIAVLDTLAELHVDKSQDPTVRLLAAGLLAQILGYDLDLSVGAPMRWRDALIRIRRRVRTTERKQIPARASVDRKKQKLDRRIDQLLTKGTDEQ